jgi:hypothetical protein
MHGRFHPCVTDSLLLLSISRQYDLERVPMEITGHKTRAILDRYNISSKDDVRDPMRKTQECLRAVSHKRKPEEVAKERRASTMMDVRKVFGP